MQKDTHKIISETMLKRVIVYVTPKLQKLSQGAPAEQLGRTVLPGQASALCSAQQSGKGQTAVLNGHILTAVLKNTNAKEISD